MVKLILNTLYLLFFFCFVFSCKHGAKQVNNSNINFYSSGTTIIIDLENKYVNRSTCLSYFRDGDQNLLYYFTGYMNKIIVIDIDKQTVLDDIQLDYKGTDGVGDANGFEVIHPDSIIITSNHHRCLSIINGTGHVTRRVNYSQYEGASLVNSPRCRSLEGMYMVRTDTAVILPYYCGIDYGNYKTIDPEDIRMVSVLYEKQNRVENMNIGFPKDFWDHGFKSTFFGFIKSPEYYVVNYMYDDRIAYSADGKDWIFKQLKSEFADLNDYERSEKRISPSYSRLVFDPYQNLYYRFVEHEQLQDPERTRTDMVRYPKQFSIMILNQDLEIIGETLFPVDIYDMNGYFITPQGVYISRSHPFNPEYDINSLVFELFTINK